MERLECSQATLYRLIAELRDYLGAPLEQDSENRGFFYDRSYQQPFELPGIWISPAELQALLTARQVLGNVQPGLLEGELQALQGRISSLLQQKGVDAQESQSRIHIQSVAGRAVPEHLFQDVMGALIGRHQLHISYHGRRKDDVSERDISPQRLTQYRNSWYLDAWCHKAEGLRSFSLERISGQALLDKKAKEVTAKVLKGHFDSSYGIFSGPAVHRAVLKFTPEMSRWIADEQWHPDQQGSFDEDGAWTLELPFSSARELVMDIMRYGPEVEVISPDSLRQAVAEAAAKTVEIYHS